MVVCSCKYFLVKLAEFVDNNHKKWVLFSFLHNYNISYVSRAKWYIYLCITLESGQEPRHPSPSPKKKKRIHFPQNSDTE